MTSSISVSKRTWPIAVVSLDFVLHLTRKNTLLVLTGFGMAVKVVTVTTSLTKRHVTKSALIRLVGMPVNCQWFQDLVRDIIQDLGE